MVEKSIFSILFRITLQGLEHHFGASENAKKRFFTPIRAVCEALAGFTVGLIGVQWGSKMVRNGRKIDFFNFVQDHSPGLETSFWGLRKAKKTKRFFTPTRALCEALVGFTMGLIGV